MTKQPTVFAIHGAHPEVLAYSMAKYSRSAKSMQETIVEISSDKAASFLQSFYFEYGHKSIADMAHIPLAVENISLLAAIEVVDEQLWDGQERSTRYQDFSKREHYIPESLSDEQKAVYEEAINTLFTGYEEMFAEALRVFAEENPRPEGMDEGKYQRTLRARAYDVARYLLPLATLTSVGQITSARTLESQISRMAASARPEVRDIADRMKKAVTVDEPFDVRAEMDDRRAVAAAMKGAFENGQAAYNTFCIPAEKTPLAPTLVKYAVADEYRRKVRAAVKGWIDTKLVRSFNPSGLLPNESRRVGVRSCRTTYPEHDILLMTIFENSTMPALFIEHALSNQPYEDIRSMLLELYSLRGKHDQLPRSTRADGGELFSVTMDIGGMRDMHRHRRATQFLPERFDIHYGFALPEPSCSPKLLDIYNACTKKVVDLYRKFQAVTSSQKTPHGAEEYFLPLGTNCQFLMALDVAEVAYIAELRTQPAGHISYRKVAWEFYQTLKTHAETLHEAIRPRVCDPADPVDFFKR